MKILSKWWWVGYPVIVVGLVLFSANILLGNGELKNIGTNRQEVLQEEALASVLRTKVSLLEGIDKNALEEQAKKLVSAVPVQKPVWQVVQGISVSASASGVVVNGYKSSVGLVKEASASADSDNSLSIDAEFDVSDFDSLATLVNNLEKRLPLTGITKIDFSFEKTTMSVSGAWADWNKNQASVANPLPEGFEKNINGAISRIESFDFGGDVEIPENNAAGTNPF